MVPTPEVTYQSTDDGSIACQSFGAGPGCVVAIPGLLSPIEAVWTRPELSGLYGALAKFTRVLLVDKRGTGLSDHAPVTVEQLTMGRARDVAAVMDAFGWSRASLFGVVDGCPAAMAFAAAFPHRVDALVLYAPWARLLHPVFGTDRPEAAIRDILQAVKRRWATDANPYWLEGLIPGLAQDAEWRLWLAHTQRLAASPSPLRH